MIAFVIGCTLYLVFASIKLKERQGIVRHLEIFLRYGLGFFLFLLMKVNADPAKFPLLYILGMLVIFLHYAFLLDHRKESGLPRSVGAYMMITFLIFCFYCLLPALMPEPRMYLAIDNQSLVVVKSSWLGLKTEDLITSQNKDGEVFYMEDSKWKQWEGPQGFFDNTSEEDQQ